MPIIIGSVLALLGVGIVNLTTKANGDSIFTPPQESSTSPIPSWVIPTAIVVVGGILLYKKGAKILKV